MTRRKTTDQPDVQPAGPDTGPPTPAVIDAAPAPTAVADDDQKTADDPGGPDPGDLQCATVAFLIAADPRFELVVEVLTAVRNELVDRHHFRARMDDLLARMAPSPPPEDRETATE